jgi:hypothetical protein
MTYVQIKELARRHSIKVVGVKKADLIRAIQRHEGNEPCFASGRASECGQHECLWLPDCA